MFNRPAFSFITSVIAMVALICVALHTKGAAYAQDGEPDFLVLNPKGE